MPQSTSNGETPHPFFSFFRPAFKPLVFLRTQKKNPKCQKLALMFVRWGWHFVVLCPLAALGSFRTILHWTNVTITHVSLSLFCFRTLFGWICPMEWMKATTIQWHVPLSRHTFLQIHPFPHLHCHPVLPNSTHLFLSPSLCMILPRVMRVWNQCHLE